MNRRKFLRSRSMILENFFCICMRKCNFVCTQSMPIRFMACVPILTLVGLRSARMRVFLCVVQFTQCQNVFVCAHILCLTSAVALSLNASPFDLFSSTTTHSLHKRDLIFHTHIGRNKSTRHKIGRVRHALAWVCQCLCHTYIYVILAVPCTLTAYVNRIYDPCVLLYCPSQLENKQQEKKR